MTKSATVTLGVSEWKRASYARAAYPQEDHLVPLFVALGAEEEEAAHVIYREETFMGLMTISSYRFGK